MCALYAAPVVGTYQEGGAQAIADGIGRSLATVKNYAHAGQLYLELKQNPQVRRVVGDGVVVHDLFLSADVLMAPTQ
jgi:hypothetical protein